MPRVYIKHSMQNTNPTADGKNEMLYAGIVADMLMQKLKSTPGIEVMLAYDGISLATVQQQIKTFKPDCAIDIHTDAGGGRGTTVLTNPQTQKFGEIVLKYVSAVNPSDPARGVKDGRQFAFINYGGIIVEMLFHDNLADTQYYVSHFADYANALYLAILEYLKVSVPTNGGDIVLDGIIIMFGDGDLAGGLNAHFLTGFPMTFKSSFQAKPTPAKLRIWVGGLDQPSTPTDIYCGGTNRTMAIIDLLKELKVL